MRKGNNITESLLFGFLFVHWFCWITIFRQLFEFSKIRIHKIWKAEIGMPNFWTTDWTKEVFNIWD